MKIKLILTTFFLAFLLLGQAFSSQPDGGLSVKFKFTSDSDEELTFMKLRRTLITRVSSEESQNAKFGIAEYYFKHNDFSDAFRDFKEFARNYPPGETTLLSKIYLYKIALKRVDADLANSLKKEIFENSFVLLFSKFKILRYKSAFNNKYEIHYYLDKIRVFLNGELFEEINP